MAGAITNSLRLAKAGLVLAQHGVRFVPPGTPVPLPLRLARIATAPDPPAGGAVPRRRAARSAPLQRPHQPRPQLHQARPVPGDARRRHRPRPRRRAGAAAGQPAAVLHGRGAPRRRGSARRQARGSFRRVRPRRRRRLHRPGAQGGRHRRRRPAARGRREDPAPRHRATVPPRPRQLLLRRPPHRAPASADAPPEAGRRGRHAEGLDRARDGLAPRGRGHLRDGGEHRRRR